MEGAQYLYHRVIDGTYQAILYWKVSDGIMYIQEPDGWKPTKVPVKFIKDIDPSHIKFRIGGKPMTNYNEILAEQLNYLMEYSYKYGRCEIPSSEDPPLIIARQAKQAILDWHNKQVEEVLDRLESMAVYDPSGSSPVINPKQIEAERNKLKESKNEQL